MPESPAKASPRRPMPEFPANLREFENRFSTDDACLAYLCALRWPNGCSCPRCGKDIPAGAAPGQRCRHCGRQAYPLAGTVFQDSHLPLADWFRAIWQLTGEKRGVTALGLQQAMGWGSYRTAWGCLHKLRHAIAKRNKLMGPLSGRILVDEAYVGPHREHRRGRGRHGRILAVVGIEENPRRKGIGPIRLCVAESPAWQRLAEAVESFAAPGSVLMTDGWPGYNHLADRGYRIEPLPGGGAIGERLLPSVRYVVGALERWLLGVLQGGVGPGHFDSYLAEFTFRFNRRHWPNRGQIFYSLLSQCVASAPIRVKDIVEGSPRAWTGP